MADVFLSYASEDRDVARALAAALGERGWSVFWDRTIPPGREFDVVIGEALHAARCVVVLWSSASVNSRWVKEEAEDAATRGILVPAVIDDAVVPLGFRRLQAARLAGWADGRAGREFQELVGSVANLVGRPAEPARAVEPPVRRPDAPGLRRPSGRREAYIAILAISAIAGTSLGVWSAMYNSDVGFVAAVPVWIVGGVIAFLVRPRA